MKHAIIFAFLVETNKHNPLDMKLLDAEILALPDPSLINQYKEFKSKISLYR